MQIGGLAIFQAMAQKMKWNQARQNVLAENVANADTPGYVGRDLTPFSIGDDLKSVAMLTTSTTSPTHFSVSSGGGSDGFGSDAAQGFETTPSGNAVTLEDQMMQVSANDIDYQTVTALYTRSLQLIRTAIGRNA